MPIELYTSILFISFATSGKEVLFFMSLSLTVALDLNGNDRMNLGLWRQTPDVLLL